jgi:4-hydroxy-2-oxoheptanedioate aldolase
MLDALAGGRRPMGMLVASVDPAITEILAVAGFEYEILDAEAAPITPALALQHVRAAEARGILPFVRMLEVTPAEIRRYLDVGCVGIVVPHAESAEELRGVLEALRFAPDGSRGMCVACHGASYALPGHHHSWGSWYESDSILVIPIIESRRALDELDGLVGIEGIDVFLFGAGDLAQEYGVPSATRMEGELLKQWRRFVEVVHAKGKYAMATPYPEVSPESTKRLFDQGADTVCHNTDLLVFHETVRKARAFNLVEELAEKS